MRRAAPRHRRSNHLRLRWRLLAVASLVISLGALFLWWQGGMWSNGALPTHGGPHPGTAGLTTSA